MILKVKDFQDSCKKILEAVDTTTKSILNETLELKEVEGKLHLNVTNREYFVSVILDTNCELGFKATVDAKLFLSLIAKITTEELELNATETSLVIKGNGTYKLPMIYEETNLLELKEITIDNPTNEFVVNSNVLLSILTYNSKELLKNNAIREVQKMYYVDNEGCITFTKGACVNSFSLEQPIKVLLNDKLVKLFKLFVKDSDVKLTLGFDEVGGVLQQKIRFSTDNIEITSILNSNESLIVSVPTQAIRGRANANYPFTIDVNRVELSEAINRLYLFTSMSNSATKTIAKINFESDCMTISDLGEENKETLKYGNSSISGNYSTLIDLNDIKLTLETCSETYLTLHFGDSQALVISRGSIKNVIPEVHLVQ